MRCLCAVHCAGYLWGTSTFLCHLESHCILFAFLSDDYCSVPNLWCTVITFQTLLICTVNPLGYKKEVNDWLNSTECSDVFQGLRSMLFKKIEENRSGLHTAENEDVYVYLAADNEQVKEAFAVTVLAAGPSDKANFTINLMRMETKFVQHIKNLANMKAATNNEGADAALILCHNRVLSIL
jgi:hypothetical protein